MVVLKLNHDSKGGHKYKDMGKTNRYRITLIQDKARRHIAPDILCMSIGSEAGKHQIFMVAAKIKKMGADEYIYHM